MSELRPTGQPWGGTEHSGFGTLGCGHIQASLFGLRPAPMGFTHFLSCLSGVLPAYLFPTTLFGLRLTEKGFSQFPARLFGRFPADHTITTKRTVVPAFRLVCAECQDVGCLCGVHLGYVFGVENHHALELVRTMLADGSVNGKVTPALGVVDMLLPPLLKAVLRLADVTFVVNRVADGVYQHENPLYETHLKPGRIIRVGRPRGRQHPVPRGDKRLEPVYFFLLAQLH